MRVRLIKNFLKLESASGIILFVMAMLAMVLANSPLAYLHQKFIDAFLFTINEGLMAIFFLVVGLELKRGFLDGQLARFSQIILPVAAAIGGMLIPALIYIYVNYDNPATIKAWATPVATDIAFALGILSLFGSRVPVALKLFLMALAIFDDIGAIIIIAIFYSHGMVYLWFFQAIALIWILYILNKVAVRRLMLYLFVGAWLWVALLHSGVHPTIAGVLLAFAIPGDHRRADTDGAFSPLQQLENALHPLAAYVVMPLFALANAGFSFHELSLESLGDELVLGIILGLFLGKQIGVFLFSWLFIQLKIAKKPEKCSWLAIYGAALLCGIGFTMSLFLGTLSFQRDSIFLAEVRLGVLVGSVLSGLTGAIMLFIAFSKDKRLKLAKRNTSTITV